MTLSKVNVPAEKMPSPPTDTPETRTGGRSASESCARIKDLGFAASKHINIYGERFELVSDPFADGECTAVQVISENDPTIRTLRLPEAILVGLSDQFRKPVKLAGPNSARREATFSLPEQAGSLANSK